MSDGKAIPREEAMAVAKEFIDMVSDGCKRLEIAGSLRRGKPEVHDIEIVAEPEYFEGKNLLALNIDALSMSGFINRDRPRKDTKKNPYGPKYYRINFTYLGKDYPLDLFCVTKPAQWGVIYLIRTGSADYSHWFVQQGYSRGIRVVEGHLEQNGVVIDTPEETDVFNAMGIPYREPAYREMY